MSQPLDVGLSSGKLASKMLPLSHQGEMLWSKSPEVTLGEAW